MAVIVKVPGIGEVEAKNAATEATLQAILAQMKGVKDQSKELADAAKDKSGKNIFSVLGTASDKFKSFNKTVGKVEDGFKLLNNIVTGTIKDFADVGDSLESAAKVLPVVAPLFTMVAAASVKLNSAFLEAARSGASFGGSVNEFARSAAQSGMTLDKFGAFLAKNSEALLGFGATTEDGATRFTQVSKALRSASGDLYALGFSTEDINQGLANYGDLLRKQGLQGTKSNAELAAGARNYLKEIDALAKITGEERSVKEAQMKALATDAQFQMALAGKSAETRESFMKLIGGFGPTLGGFVKDFVATGTLTTEANQRIASALGQETMDELNNLRQKMLNNQTLTAQEQDRLRAIIKRSSEAGAKQLGSTLAATREYDDMSKAYIEGQQIQVDAVQKATEEQKKAAKFGDGFNKRIQEMQQRLAELSTAFTAILADSKILDVMMGAFNTLAYLTNLIIVPAFQLLTGAVSLVANFISTFVYPAFLQIVGMFQTQFMPVISSIAETITSVVKPAFEFVGGVVTDYVLPAFRTIGGYLLDNVMPILGGLTAGLIALNASVIYGNVLQGYRNTVIAAGNAFETARNFVMGLSIAGLQALAMNAWAAALPLIKIAAPILLMVGLFKLLYDRGFTFQSALEELTDGFLRLLNKVTLGKMGLSEDEYKARSEARAQARVELAEERKNGKDRKDREEAAAKLDKKIMGGKEKYADTIEKSNKSIDANSGPEALAKQFAKAEGSYLIPKDQQASTAADTTKKEIENKAEAKAKEEVKQEVKQEQSGKTPTTTQESAESLLAQLNSRMAELIKISAQTTTNTYETVVATKGLSKDLYKAF